MVHIPLRRVFRVLWALCAVALLLGLPMLVLDFKRSQYSVHYQVGCDTRQALYPSSARQGVGLIIVAWAVASGSCPA